MPFLCTFPIFLNKLHLQSWLELPFAQHYMATSSVSLKPLSLPCTFESMPLYVAAVQKYQSLDLYDQKSTGISKCSCEKWVDLNILFCLLKWKNSKLRGRI